MNCRACGSVLSNEFVDLGFQPLSNSYLRSEQLVQPETFLPLKAMVCSNCFLVQTQDYTRPENIFDSNYAYFSSVSKSWVDHAKRYTDEIINKFKIKKTAFILEIASNDGYLLQNFHKRGFDCLGVEPTKKYCGGCKKKRHSNYRNVFWN